MRIPLDYYRILGLPIQATGEQLQQAHRDRTLQLPRREFSEAAIAARKQLIDEAYEVLSDSAQRQDYDVSFLAKSYELLEVGRSSESSSDGAIGQFRPEGNGPDLGVDSYTPSIEIQDFQFVGALLILLELGEYELVLKLGRPYLSSGNLSLKDGQFGEPEIVSADIVLTVALACLELGREQWQQAQYESAAESLETGQDLLLREGLFANIRGEMQADLFKLRPYRVLELVSLPENRATERRQGLSLLEDMLQDRMGIDGAGEDQSGLSTDDFLRFIQQLRSYLTATEQQALFEAEARRPSAVATYLAIYALLARGFAQRQPALIRRAKVMLTRLGTRQDVHLEQAVCALLLGQTEEASRALELSQEFESLAFIREHSQGSPDLLPGLCLYSERWLQNEVFPHFRDLARKQASLKEYFADEDVQVYLEELPTDAEPSPRWTAPPAYRQAPPRREVSPPPMEERLQTFGHEGRPSAASRGIATIEAPEYPTSEPATVPEAERVEQSIPEARSNGAQPRSARGKRPPQPPSPDRPHSQPGGPARSTQTGAAVRKPGGRSTPRIDRILLLAALGLFGFLALGFLISKVFGRPQTVKATASTSGQVASQQVEKLQPGFSTFATEQEKTIATSAPLTQENAPDLIKTWLSAKAAAMGESHEIDQLDKILADPALARQKARAEEVKSANSYWKYDHSNIEVISVQTTSDEASSEAGTGSEQTPISTDASGPSGSSSREQTANGTLSSPSSPSSSPDSNSPDSAASPDLNSSESTGTDANAASGSSDTQNQAQVEATVTEKAQFYANGRLDESSSYNSTVRVRYDLIRKDGQWRIQDMQVLE